MISGSFKSDGYDFSQRAYRLSCDNPGEPSTVLMVDASSDAPMMNGCFIMKNWGNGEPVVEVDGRILKKGKECRTGKIQTLEGSDLILWIEKDSTVPVRIKISSQNI
jgi:hypothetical protein